jgi:ribonuclease HII
MVKHSLSFGVDEAGRWAWAGPVYAAACVFLKPKFKRTLTWWTITDSKLLSTPLRDRIYEEMHEARDRGEIAFAVGSSSAETIDRVWIKEANRLAMEMAIQELIRILWHNFSICIKVDGRDHYRFNLEVPHALEEHVGWDRRFKEIGAASILAKVSRDRYMQELERQYPYGFDLHKGYGTKWHREKLEKSGPSPEHRFSYAPIRVFGERKFFTCSSE